MAFNTVAFGIFFIIAIFGYYIVPQKHRWVFLLVASYVFYGYASIRFIPYLLATTLTVYVATISMSNSHRQEKLQLAEGKETLDKDEKKAIKEKAKKYRKRVLIFTLLFNFGILFVLKYFNFFVETLNSIFHLDSAREIPRLNLILPLGISFYTFQSVSYIVDVYWKKVEAERNLGKIALFVSFFPQMLLGPIGRFGDLSPQLSKGNNFDSRNIKFGLQLMAWGFFKKMVIADRVAIVADAVFKGHGQMSGITVFIGVFMYVIQDYTDFSGSVDIARGVARCMGIKMAENFKRPYFSKTVPEFWRRWHMTLGSFMKDYVFYPFALTNGVRKLSKVARERFGEHIGKTLPIALGNLLVFFIVGVWHGASWNYILWGTFYGVLIAISGMIKPLFDKLNEFLKINVKSRAFIVWQIARTFWITCIAAIIFRAEGIKDTFMVFKKFLNIFDLPKNYVKEFLSLNIDPLEIVIIPLVLIILLVVDLMQERTHVRTALENKNPLIRFAIYLIGFLIIVGFGIYGPGFDQNQFVYMQF